MPQVLTVLEGSAFWDRPLFPVLSLRPKGQVRFPKGGAAGCGLLGHQVFHRLAQVGWASLTVPVTWVPGGFTAVKLIQQGVRRTGGSDALSKPNL